ncbi:NAD(P)/FAD-dependent oxidoreductase [Actinoplanes sp. NPDC000266]
MRIVIAGAGVAGVSTAAALRAGGFGDTITLIDAGDFPHDRPPLTKDYLAGHSDAKQLALQPPEWYDQQDIDLRVNTSVVALRPSAGGVELSDSTTLPADFVVLATGGRAARPPIPGIGAAHTIRTIEDADRLRTHLVPGTRVLVIGAGLIGAELASTAAALGCAVVLVDPVAVPLAGAVGTDFATWLHEQHATRGITTLHAGVAELREHEAILTDGRTVPFDVVVAGVGMTPATRLAESAGLAVDRGILVDQRQVTSHPHVLAVGDPSRRTGENRAEHWEAAQRGGERAAATLLGIAAPPAQASWFWTDRHGYHVEAVGRMADADLTVLRGSFDDTTFAVFGLRGDSVVAAASVNDSIAVRTARRLIDRGLVVSAAQLADPSVNLRRLVKG